METMIFLDVSDKYIIFEIMIAWSDEDMMRKLYIWLCDALKFLINCSMFVIKYIAHAGKLRSMGAFSPSVRPAA